MKTLRNGPPHATLTRQVSDVACYDFWQRARMHTKRTYTHVTTNKGNHASQFGTKQNSARPCVWMGALRNSTQQRKENWLKLNL